VIIEGLHAIITAADQRCLVTEEADEDKGGEVEADCD